MQILALLRHGVLTALLSALIYAPNAGAGIDDARAAFARGDFPAAAVLASPINSPESHLLTAQALSAQVMLGTSENAKEAARMAIIHAEAALAFDPDNQEAHLQRALADGFITRAASPLSAARKKLPQKTRGVVDALITRSPDDARAHALLGAWHLGIVRKAGVSRGRKWFGADIAAGMAAYEAALVRKPGDIIISGNYALSLIELDFDRHAPAAKAMMEAAAAQPTDDPVERAVQNRLSRVLSLWETPRAAKKSAGRFLDGDG